MQPIPGKPLTGAFGLRDLVLVMREDKIDAATVNVSTTPRAPSSPTSTAPRIAGKMSACTCGISSVSATTSPPISIPRLSDDSTSETPPATRTMYLPGQIGVDSRISTLAILAIASVISIPTAMLMVSMIAIASSRPRIRVSGWGLVFTNSPSSPRLLAALDNDF